MDGNSTVFSGIADWQEEFRPPYPPAVLDVLTEALMRPLDGIRVADIGAGTGRWTRQLAHAGAGPISAIEPNPRMRALGAHATSGLDVRWHAATGTDTGLPSGAFDLVTWASSFHHAAIEAALDESLRLLSPSGCLAILCQGRKRDDRASAADGRGALEIEKLIEAIDQRAPDRALTVAAIEETRVFDVDQARGYLNAVAYLQRAEAAHLLAEELAALARAPDGQVAWRLVTSAVLVSSEGGGSDSI